MADNKFLDQAGLSTLWSRIGTYYARVRRDNDYNYRNDFVPIEREICLADTSRGLRAKVGDGASTWAELAYTDEPLYVAIDNIVQRGYYYEGNFYSDSSHETPLTPSVKTIYIEASRSDIYIYSGNKYVSVNDNLPTANASVAGIMKLYNTTGQNIDGTMTQKSITDKFDTKVSAVVDATDTELLILSTN